jgi:hypothetical protein
MNASRWAGAFGGARVGNPRWARILAITAGASMAAMSVKGPPQYGCHVDFKHPFEQLGPAQAGRRGCGGCSAVLIGGGRCLVGLAWDDLGSEGSVGREHAMEANEMERGRGTSAARRCMNSSGAITR